MLWLSWEDDQLWLKTASVFMLKSPLLVFVLAFGVELSGHPLFHYDGRKGQLFPHPLLCHFPICPLSPSNTEYRGAFTSQQRHKHRLSLEFSGNTFDYLMLSDTFLMYSLSTICFRVVLCDLLGLWCFYFCVSYGFPFHSNWYSNLVSFLHWYPHWS